MKIEHNKYLTLAGAATLVQVVMFLLTPVLTRIFTPEDFGGSGVIIGVGALLAGVGTLRLEHAIPIARGMAESIRLAILGFFFSLITALLAVFFIKLSLLSNLWTSSAWDNVPLYLLPVLVVAMPSFQVINALLLKRKAYGAVAKCKVIQGLSTGAIQLWLGLLGLGSSGLVAGQALAYVVGCAREIPKLFPRLISQIYRRRGRLAETLFAYRRYPLLMTPAALFNLTSQQLPLFAIAYLYGLVEVGIYALVMRICGAPLSLIGQSVAQVYAADFLSHVTAGSSNLARHYAKLLVILTLIGIPIVTFFVVGLKFGGDFIFGSDWKRMGDISLYLSIMLVVDFATTPVATTLAYLGHLRDQLLWDVSRFCAVLAVFLMAYATSMNFEGTLFVHACVWSLMLFIHIAITWRACVKTQNIISQ